MNPLEEIRLVNLVEKIETSLVNGTNVDLVSMVEFHDNESLELKYINILTFDKKINSVSVHFKHSNIKQPLVISINSQKRIALSYAGHFSNVYSKVVQIEKNEFGKNLQFLIDAISDKSKLIKTEM